MPIEEVKITYHVTFDVKKAYSTVGALPPGSSVLAGSC